VIYSVKEGSTGVLYLTDEKGHTKIYQPNCDLDKSQQYLYKYHALSICNNEPIKESFVVNGIDWYPASVSMLYWQFFFQYVKYESLILDWKSGKVGFSHIDQGRFKKILILLGYGENHRGSLVVNILRKILSRVTMIRNKLLVNSDVKKILFLRLGLDDFRTNEILQDLQKDFSVVQLIPFPKRKIIRTILDPSVCILPISYKNHSHADLSEIRVNDETDWLYQYAISYTKELIFQHITSYKLFNGYMSIATYRLFVGLDDCNYPYPYIYSAQDNGLKCIGIQHGGYAKRHEAYVMNGLNSHRWYDYLLVWGEHWKKVFLDNNEIFPAKNVIVTTNKHNYDYTILPKVSKKRSILIPYEFLADTILIGKFIIKLYVNKFDIYFKPRSDEAIEDQIKAYNLGDVESKLILIHEITPETMSNIDIVAGTMTTLLYDLLPYGKPIWILETPFKLQEDMVEFNLARKIKWSDLSNIDEIYSQDIRKNTYVDSDFFSGTVSHSDAIKSINV